MNAPFFIILLLYMIINNLMTELNVLKTKLLL